MIHPEVSKYMASIGSKGGKVLSPAKLAQLRAAAKRPKPRKSKVCQSCGSPVSGKEHPCPYSQDINGDNKTLCNCCEKCEQRCCDEI